MNKIRMFSLFAIALTLGFAALTVIPEDAEARRFGGGSSFGSRGSRSFSVPRQSTSRSTTATNPTSQRRPANTAAATAGGRSGFGSGLMGGIGGLLLGGMIGSMLFGGGGGMAGGAGAGGGIGFLEIVLIGGAIWFLFRWYKRKQATSSSAAYGGGTQPSTMPQGPMDFSSMGGQSSNQDGYTSGDNQNFDQPLDEVSQGIEYISQTDPNFQEEQFLDGAKMAFQQIQGAWSDWSVDRLRSLMTDRMGAMAEAQAAERKAQGVRDIIEKINFNKVEVSEAWQESGENWITVRFMVSMIEYSTDVGGKLLEGSQDTPVEVEEYWTFTRPVGAQDPNWFLASVQQAGEVARSNP